MNVFDFDNTIYDGETLIDFALHYVKTDPKIWKYVPKLLVICFKDAFHLFTVEEAIEAYASFLEGYFIHIKTLDEDVVKFWDKNEKKIKPWYNEVRRDDDIVVSGSTDFLLDEIMKRIGIKNYVGSSIDKKTGKFKVAQLTLSPEAFCSLKETASPSASVRASLKPWVAASSAGCCTSWQIPTV